MPGGATCQERDLPFQSTRTRGGEPLDGDHHIAVCKWLVSPSNTDHRSLTTEYLLSAALHLSAAVHPGSRRAGERGSVAGDKCIWREPDGLSATTSVSGRRLGGELKTHLGPLAVCRRAKNAQGLTYEMGAGMTSEDLG